MPESSPYHNDRYHARNSSAEACRLRCDIPLGGTVHPMSVRPRYEKAAVFTSWVLATRVKVEGITVIESPCDIHTVEFSRTPRMRGSFSSCQAKLARPYSRVSADSTFPPTYEPRIAPRNKRQVPDRHHGYDSNRQKGH